MAVRFQYECHDADGQWYRSYGNELWEFTPQGLSPASGRCPQARQGEASINDVQIDESERRYLGPRPESEYGLDIPLW
jgi:hypothetical protein